MEDAHRRRLGNAIRDIMGAGLYDAKTTRMMKLAGFSMNAAFEEASSCFFDPLTRSDNLALQPQHDIVTRESMFTPFAAPGIPNFWSDSHLEDHVTQTYWAVNLL